MILHALKWLAIGIGAGLTVLAGAYLVLISIDPDGTDHDMPRRSTADPTRIW